MKFKLSPLASDIVISVYAIITLFLRFKYESDASVSVINSVVIGAAFLVIIWALIKLEILNPNWFGLFKSKNSKS